MIIPVDENLNHVFVTSDHHFRHENIIEYCNRPFADILEMDNALIDNWNKVVRPQDWVIHLGDFTLEGIKIARDLFSQLNGDICILSNPWHHDKRWLEFSRNTSLKSKGGFDVRLWPSMVILEVPRLGKGGYPLTITLCHYPMAVWDRKHYGAWHLHGHSHGNYQLTSEIGPDYENHILDVGVDCQNFEPISLAKISFMMLAR